MDPRTESNPNPNPNLEPNPNPNLILTLILTLNLTLNLTLILTADSRYPITWSTYVFPRVKIQIDVHDVKPFEKREIRNGIHR